MRLRDLARHAWQRYTAIQRPAPAWTAGRYGFDQLGKVLVVASIVCMALAFIPKLGFLSWIALILLAICYWRAFSRNTARRYQENMTYLRYKKHTGKWWSGFRRSCASRRSNHWYRCPSCHRKALVPRGTGRVKITCRNCKTEFYRNA